MNCYLVRGWPEARLYPVDTENHRYYRARTRLAYGLRDLLQEAIPVTTYFYEDCAMAIRNKGYLVMVMLALSMGSANADTTGNRYGYPVLYHSDISSAQAWLETTKKGKTKGKARPVIIDVRRVEEYVAGHPAGAISIPFPHVTGSPSEPNDSADYIGYDISVDPEVGFLAADGNDGNLPIQEFIDYVEANFPNKDQPLYLLCATGHRSVQAANALAKYGKYTNVRNIWEGYNGQPKYAYTGNVPTQPLVALDLNNDGLVDAQDRDGWAYFQGLPTEAKLVKRRLFKPYISLYVNTQ